MRRLLPPSCSPCSTPSRDQAERGNQGREMTVAVAERLPFDAAFGTVSDAEERSDFAVDDRLPGSLRRASRPARRRAGASTREALPGGRGGAGETVGSPPRTSVLPGRRTAPRFGASTPIGKASGNSLEDASPPAREAVLRQALARDPAAGREVLDLVAAHRRARSPRGASRTASSSISRGMTEAAGTGRRSRL